jgi:cyclase
MIDNGKAVVTRTFRKPVYVGDPINSIRIFNEKEVDELIILDITDPKKRSQPDFGLIEKMASESFMPLAYGGHVKSVKDAERIITCGVEKISFNTALFQYPEVVKELSYRNGKQSVIASLDVARNWLGQYRVKSKGGTVTVGQNLPEVLRQVLALGVGEVLLNSIDRDGTFGGYDLELISLIATQCPVPVIACGGAASLHDFHHAIVSGKASAVAAGAFFFFKGGFNSVLVNYPDQPSLFENLYSKL